jgi:hypoxanthine phosphoribosyltransferase
VVKWRWIIYPWALMEDLRGIIREVGEGCPVAPDDLVQPLQREHGIRVSRQSLEDALAFMDPAGKGPVSHY